MIALAYKEMPGAPDEPVYAVKDEAELTLLGFLAFLDPPKATAGEALTPLNGRQVAVKVLTGDNEIVTRYICQQVGMPVERMLLGAAIEGMSEAALAEAAETTTIFAKLAPAHKERIIHALQSKGHVVGFLGDGINDAPALKAADVGISVNSAVDIAKESSDIILLETSLLVLEKGVVEGRRVFGNVVKYIKMAASSSFGNMFSVVGASAFLPFVPMLPIQVLINNLLYDVSQTAIPSDRVDADWLSRPRKWTISDIRRFILFIGPISSIFDYLTFWIMLARVSCTAESRAVSHRMVRGVAVHADADHSHHPDQQDSVPAEPGELAADRRVGSDPGDRNVAHRVAPGADAGVCRAAEALLATARGDAVGVHVAHASGKELVPLALWGLSERGG